LITLALAVACSQPITTFDTPVAQASPAPAGHAELPETVATIGDDAITRAELEAKAAPGVMAAMQEAHKAREQALEGLIVDRLLETASKARDMEIEALLKIEVEDKATSASDEEVEAFYNQNKAQMPGPIEMMRDRIREHLGGQGKADRMRAYIDELKAASKVQTFLEPYRIEVPARDNAARKGTETAPVHIVEFSDFQCPYCTRAAATMDEVVAAYGDKVSLEYRHFPLDFHDRAHRAAQAAECANDQGKFWAYHDLLFANQKAMSEENLTSYAQQASLDADGFASCMSANKHSETVDADIAAGAQVGMSGTPGFYVNGRVLTGAQPFEEFKRVIDAELAAKGL
jgi:protein-disulfide isomerase